MYFTKKKHRPRLGVFFLAELTELMIHTNANETSIR